MAETVCPECGGSGWKVIEKEDVSAAQRCDCLFSERAKRLEENASIPPLYRQASFDNFILPRDNPIAMRELANVIERAAMICPAETVGGGHIAMPVHRPSIAPKECTPAGESASRLDLPTQLDDIERRELSIALTKCAGNKAEVARMLGIQRTTLYYRLKRLGIDA